MKLRLSVTTTTTTTTLMPAPDFNISYVTAESASASSSTCDRTCVASSHARPVNESDQGRTTAKQAKQAGASLEGWLWENPEVVQDLGGFG